MKLLKIYQIILLILLLVNPAYSDNNNINIYRSRIDNIVLDAARQYALPYEIIHAVIKAESNYNPWAVSKKGAQGLMQIMPETAKFLGIKNPFNLKQNIFGGTKYLKSLFEKYDNNFTLALAAYNAGPGNIVNNKVPNFSETRRYISSISKYIKQDRPLFRKQVNVIELSY